MIRGALWLVGATAGIALVNYLIAQYPPSAEAITPAANVEQTPGQQDQLEPFAMPEGVQLTHARERPVFRPSRKPWTPPAEPPVAMAEPMPDTTPVIEPPPAPLTPQAPPLEVSLIGVQLDPKGSRALVLRPGAPEPLWIRSGDVVDGWTVAAISAGSLSMTSGSETKTFDLYLQPDGAVQ